VLKADNVCICYHLVTDINDLGLFEYLSTKSVLCINQGPMIADHDDQNHMEKSTASAKRYLNYIY
jgi:hypothetical protein